MGRMLRFAIEDLLVPLEEAGEECQNVPNYAYVNIGGGRRMELQIYLVEEEDKDE